MSARRRLDELLEERDLEAVWLARPNSFGWLTGGSNTVVTNDDLGVAAAGYDGESLTVVTDTIEAPRLDAEELPPQATVRSFPWYEQSLSAAVVDVSPRPAAADFDVPGLEQVDVAPLRSPLGGTDTDLYRTLGEEAAGAVERACRDLDPSLTERTAAGMVKAELADAGIEAPVVLVGGADRAGKYRHFTPTSARLGAYSLVSVTAARAGLHASLTRTVAFDPPSWLAERHAAAARVEVSALAATRRAGRQGGTGASVFDAVRTAYDAVGFPGEWERHHQGGPAGYAGREWIATPTTEHPVELPMGYAWNPTVQGAKSENTWLVTEDGFECLTETGRWPAETYDAVGDNVSLECHAILSR